MTAMPQRTTTVRRAATIFHRVLRRRRVGAASPARRAWWGAVRDCPAKPSLTPVERTAGYLCDNGSPAISSPFFTMVLWPESGRENHPQPASEVRLDRAEQSEF